MKVGKKVKEYCAEPDKCLEEVTQMMRVFIVIAEGDTWEGIGRLTHHLEEAEVVTGKLEV